LEYARTRSIYPFFLVIIYTNTKSQDEDSLLLSRYAPFTDLFSPSARCSQGITIITPVFIAVCAVRVDAFEVSYETVEIIYFM